MFRKATDERITPCCRVQGVQGIGNGGCTAGTLNQGSFGGELVGRLVQATYAITTVVIAGVETLGHCVCDGKVTRLLGAGRF